MNFLRALQLTVDQEKISSHLEVDLLEDYYRGELPQERSDEVQEHLVCCAQCAELFLDFVRFQQYQTVASDVSPDDLVSGWETLQQHLLTETRH